MERPDYDKILKDKIEHYGETKAAYQFAAEELARKEVEFALLDVRLMYGLNRNYLINISNEKRKRKSSNATNRIKTKVCK